MLRLRDDGSVPPDNPFVGKSGYQPEIYSLGHRSPQGLAVHPETGALWENEHGPLGGDELNVVLPGRNYGWPLVTYGTWYDGEKVSDATARADLEPPFVYWVPSIAVSGLAFYTGDRFPAWKGNVFVGAMFEGRTRGTGHLQRITVNDKGRPIQREPILTELRQRIRDVRQGPDGLLYVLTDEDNGMLLRLEPARGGCVVIRALLLVAAALATAVDARRPARRAESGGRVDGPPALPRPGRGDEQALLDRARRNADQDRPCRRREVPGRHRRAGTAGASSGTSEGAVLNHVAFRVRTFAQVEAAGLKVDRLAQFPGVGYTYTPEKERVELFEDAALNLTFTPDTGPAQGVVDRHNRPVSTPVAFHHVHLYLPGDAHLEAKAWYARMFGGVPGKRSQYDAVDLPGINFNFSGGRTAAPMKGRTLDHIGFEVRNLQAFCTRLESMGVKFDAPFQKGPDGVSFAVLTDPWGTTIELTEGLNVF